MQVSGVLKDHQDQSQLMTQQVQSAQLEDIVRLIQSLQQLVKLVNMDLTLVLKKSQSVMIVYQVTIVQETMLQKLL